MSESLGPSNDKIPRDEWLKAHSVAKEFDASSLRNREFNSASPERKRVLIAEDVLKWLGTGKLRADTGVYFRIDDDERRDERRGARWGELQEVGDYNCTACAVGGAAAALVGRLGGAKAFCSLVPTTHILADVRDVSRYWEDVLAPFFSRAQSILMECAFEMTPNFHDGDVDVDLAQDCIRASQFGLQHVDDRARMTAIYQNIIDNNGTFIP